jgi:peptide/nickel transport system substrate-binding protein
MRHRWRHSAAREGSIEWAPRAERDTEMNRRRRSRQPLTSLVALVSLAILLGVVVGSAGAAGGQALPVLRVGLPLDYANLSPTRLAGAGGQNAMLGDLVYGGFTHMTPNGNFTPEHAVRWRYVKTNRGAYKRFEFTIRRDIRYPDGTRMTAPMIVNWFQLYQKASASFSGYLGTNPQFEAVDKWTVRITLATPTPDLPRVLADNGFNWGYVPSAAAQKNPDILATGTYGAGPYMLDPGNSVKGDRYVLVPNPRYYNKTSVRFSRIELKIIPAASSRLQALQSGQLDVAVGDISTNQAAQRAGLQIAQALSQISVLLVNTRAEPKLNDVRVRQALNYAMNRRAVVKALFRSWGKPTSSIITSDADPGLANYYAYSPNRARQLLSQAGHANGLALKVQSLGPGVTGDTLVQAYAKNWEDVGINLQITQRDVNAWVQNFPSTALSQSSVFISTTTSRWGVYLRPGAFAAVWGSDPEVYRLYYRALKARDPIATWKQMWKRVTEQAFFIPLAAYSSVYYYDRDITGVPQSVTVQRAATPLVTEWGHR